jgi:hypothetical protein
VAFLKLWRQTEALEPIDQIVAEQQQVKVGFVGQEVMTGDTAECVIFLELANDQFDTGAVVVPHESIQLAGVQQRAVRAMPRWLRSGI